MTLDDAVTGEELQVLVQHQLIAALQEREHDLAEAQRQAHLGSWTRDVATGQSVWSDELFRLLDLEISATPSFETFVARVHPDDRDEVQRVISEAENGALPATFDIEFRGVDNGSTRWFRARGEVTGDPTGPVRSHGTLQDISADVASREALEGVERRCRILDQVVDARFITRYDDDGVSILRGSSHTPGGPAVGMDLSMARDVVHPDDVDRIEGEVARLRRSPGSTMVARFRAADGAGSWATFEARGTNDARDPAVGTIVSIHPLDDTALPPDDAHASRDPLTGLPNHTAFIDHARMAVFRGQRNGWSTAVVVIDIDGFHDINVVKGHEVGDAVLIDVASRLAQTLRVSDALGRLDADVQAEAHNTVARFGGDRFAAVCENVGDVDAARVVADRLRAELERPIVLGDGEELLVTVGIGLAITGPTNDGIERRIHHAEDALRSAKGAGRGQVVVVDEGVATDRELRRLVEHGLLRAIAEDEFVLHYQPKVSFESDRITGVEALLRWEDPARGMIPPLDFIPLAEETGLILPIGTWVIEEACRQVAAWQVSSPRNPGLVMSVNVSGRQFSSGLVETVAAALQSSGIEADQLCLEVTESTLIADSDGAIETLRELVALGVRLSIDDFGTGYSSLSYLKRFPLHELKIDKSFVDGVGTDADDTAIIAATVAMAHALGLSVTAEGVESADQFERLRVIGCQEAQGYFISRPRPAPQVTEMLALDADRGWRSAPSVGPAPTSERQGPPRILIVDDAADVRQLAHVALAATGFEVFEADGGAEGIRLATELVPDCVILDVSMPEVSGIDVCRALRREPSTAGCTILMLTSNNRAEDKIEAFSGGADDYIIKPFSPRDLVSRVRAALRRDEQDQSASGAS